MGYSLAIGEKWTSYDEKLDYTYTWVHSERHKEAPAFGEPADHENQRWPSYSTWSNFARESGLMHVLYPDGGILGGHPGQAPITEKMRQEINTAYHHYRAAHPYAEPGFKEELFTGKPIPNSENMDDTLARFEWLKYWVNWAMDNCKNPIFVNT